MKESSISNLKRADLMNKKKDNDFSQKLKGKLKELF
jgi:hypothetical protein